MATTNTNKKTTRNTKGKEAVQIIETISERLGYDLFDKDDYLSFFIHAQFLDHNKENNEKSYLEKEEKIKTINEMLDEDNSKTDLIRNLNENDNSY